MNISVLKKCLEELQKENFRKDYVVGMLETLIDLQEPQARVEQIKKKIHSMAMNLPEITPIPTDEGQILDAATRARIAKVREMSEKSTEMS